MLAKILFRLKVRGLEHLPRERPFLICPNHQSYMDGALVASALPYRVIRYLFTLGFTPFFSGGFKDVIARLLRIVPIDADTNVWRAMRISAIGLKARQNLIIFPEGSLSCDGELQVFKKGAAILAHELHIPIVPVAIHGSFNAWSKVGHGIRLAPISITFGPPLEPDEHETPHEEQDLEYARITRRIRDSISRLLEDAKDATQYNNGMPRLKLYSILMKDFSQPVRNFQTIPKESFRSPQRRPETMTTYGTFSEELPCTQSTPRIPAAPDSITQE